VPGNGKKLQKKNGGEVASERKNAKNLKAVPAAMGRVGYRIFIKNGGAEKTNQRTQKTRREKKKGRGGKTTKLCKKICPGDC